MIWLYRILFVPVLVLLSPIYLRRMWRRGGYRGGFRQRAGGHNWLAQKTPGKKRVWLQAVSVGEMLAIGPILEGLYRDGVEVYLTTTTNTGFRIGNDRYLAWVVDIGYFPIDWWPFVRRTWKRIDPDLVILTEGERWPEHMHQARIRGVPVLNINARLSDRSYSRLKMLRPVAHIMLDDITRLLPCSAQDETRFRELGVPAEKIFTTGNIKLDVAITPLTDAERLQLRREVGLPAEGFVLLGSSTWPGEEEAMFEALRLARAAGHACSLLLVPRHAERRIEIDRWLRTAGVTFHFRSRGIAPGEVDVAVADTTGELRKLTQLADVVFIGKSLAPHTEGQTPVEAAALGKPILFGPGMSNFRLLAADLVERGAALQVENTEALAATGEALLRDPVRRAGLAAAAAGWRLENGGAVGRTLEVVRAELARRG